MPLPGHVSIEAVLEEVHLVSVSMQIDLLKPLGINVYAVVFHGSSLTASFYVHQPNNVSFRRRSFDIRRRTTKN
jgi:hypothetical protein